MIARLLAGGLLVLGLAGCASPIPPQPAEGAPSASASPAATAIGSSAAAAAAPSPTAAGRIATVTGTGRFGLSIRKAPGLSGERIATVPDGFQAAVIAGPVGKDGYEWYQLKGQDVSGWASSAYLSLAGASAASPNGSVNPLGTPLSGILSQLGRDSNYAVGSSGVFVEQPLKPAVDHTAASPTATALLRKVAPAYVRITVAHFPATSEGGEFSTLGHSIKIADSIMTESLDVQTTVLSHELQHAADILVDHDAPDNAQECVNLELRAFQTQEKVWLELTKPAPATTKMEGELDTLSHSVNSPSFAQQLAKLYAGECNSYGSGH